MRLGAVIVFVMAFTFVARCALADDSGATAGATPAPTPTEPAPAPTATLPPPAPPTAVSPTPQPTRAPKRFGEPGTVEVTGGLSISSQTSKAKFDDSSTLQGGTATSTYSQSDFEPYVGYFFADGAELTAGLLILSDSSSTKGGGGFGDQESDVSIGGALLPANQTDTFRIGPAVELRLDNFTNRNRDSSGSSLSNHLSGPNASVMLMTKSVVGKSGVLTADIGYHRLVSKGHASLSGAGSTTEHYTASGFFTGVGFGVWF